MTLSIKGAVRQELDDTVRCGLDNLMVTGGKKNNARELDESVV